MNEKAAAQCSSRLLSGTKVSRTPLGSHDFIAFWSISDQYWRGLDLGAADLAHLWVVVKECGGDTQA